MHPFEPYRVRRRSIDMRDQGNDGVYQLNPEGTFEWDVEQFESALSRARSAPGGSRERAVSLQEALELYAGPFATTFHSEWADAIRGRLEGEANESLAALAGYFAGREDFEAASLCMEKVLRANRFNEEAADQLARYRLARHVVQALSFIDEYGSTYANEFGEDPPRARGLRAAIAPASRSASALARVSREPNLYLQQFVQISFRDSAMSSRSTLVAVAALSPSTRRPAPFRPGRQRPVASFG